MCEWMRRLWHDERGSYLLLEWLLVVLFLVIGMISALTALRQALTTEAEETANAILALNQSYSFSGNKVEAAHRGHRAARAVESRDPLRSGKERGREYPFEGRRGYAAVTGGSAVKDTPGLIRTGKVEAKQVNTIDVDADDDLRH